jgi:hypothetical protein
MPLISIIKGPAPGNRGCSSACEREKSAATLVGISVSNGRMASSIFKLVNIE